MNSGAQTFSLIPWEIPHQAQVTYPTVTVQAQAYFFPCWPAPKQSSCAAQLAGCRSHDSQVRVCGLSYGIYYS